MKGPTECILTADDRLHDKYTCSVCSALLNIRPVNVADMAYHYFLFSSPQNSLPGSPDCHQPHSALTTSHLLTSSLGDVQTEERPGKRFKHPANMLCIHSNRALTATGLNAAVIPSNELACWLLNAVQVKQTQHVV